MIGESEEMAVDLRHRPEPIAARCRIRRSTGMSWRRRRPAPHRTPDGKGVSGYDPAMDRMPVNYRPIEADGLTGAEDGMAP
ncbi:hypothetical protein Pden_3346 [Paracoccus denitrificans PD1222]|uniref:Uncharacterized protein n=3 Tax=Paracoccus TaxID=265 RepID=A1B7C5_PARDP|nr:hypothetical protein Pden_3346 [Paracoccus denitrificans PD1222]